MILVLDAVNHDLHDDIYADMLRMRRRALKAYGMSADTGLAMYQPEDQFDQMSPANLVCLSRKGRVIGSMRLLQTSGPHMLSLDMSEVLGGEFSLRSPYVWECSRIEIDPEIGEPFSFARREVTAKLFIGAMDIALKSSVSDLVTIYDDHYGQLIRDVGANPYEIIGRASNSILPSGRYLEAGLIECTPEKIRKIRERSGVFHDVLRTDLEAREVMDEAVGPVVEPSIVSAPAAAPSSTNMSLEQKVVLARHYVEQALQAKTDEERRNALEMARLILDENT